MCNHYRADPDWRERTGEYSEIKIRTRFMSAPIAPGSNRSPLEIYPRDHAVIRAAAETIDGHDLEQVDMRWGFILQIVVPNGDVSSPLTVTGTATCMFQLAIRGRPERRKERRRTWKATCEATQVDSPGSGRCHRRRSG